VQTALFETTTDHHTMTSFTLCIASIGTGRPFIIC